MLFIVGGVNVSNDELKPIKEDVAEIKSDVKTLSNNFNDFRVFLAETYITKKDHKDDMDTANKRIDGIYKNALTIAGLISTVIGVVAAIAGVIVRAIK